MSIRYLLDTDTCVAWLRNNTIDRSALPHSFYTFLASQTPPDHLNLLVIDQFEEVFTQAEAEQREALFRLLVDVPPFHAIRTHILITVRSDYLPEVFAISTLFAQVKAGLELRTMTEVELRAAIQRPIQSLSDPLAHQKRFEQALLERLAADAAPDTRCGLPAAAPSEPRRSLAARRAETGCLPHPDRRDSGSGRAVLSTPPTRCAADDPPDLHRPGGCLPR
nr:hypothetical protein [Candidatus Oscillochloris fontis]